jgi:hypothetical protein
MYTYKCIYVYIYMYIHEYDVTGIGESKLGFPLGIFTYIDT